jgi:hypothetical protein
MKGIPHIFEELFKSTMNIPNLADGFSLSGCFHIEIWFPGHPQWRVRSDLHYRRLSLGMRDMFIWALIRHWHFRFPQGAIYLYKYPLVNKHSY